MSKKKKKNIVKIPGKVPYKVVQRENEQLKKKLNEVNKLQMNTFNTMFMVSVNFYDENPDHEMFISGYFQEGFLAQIKQASVKRKEAAEKAAEAKKVASEAREAPEKLEEGKNEENLPKNDEK